MPITAIDRLLEINRKIDYFHLLRKSVEKKLKWKISTGEAQALAFILERCWNTAPDVPGCFLREILLVQDSDSSFETSFKIHEAIFRAKMEEADERITRVGALSSEAERIRLLKQLMMSSYKDILAIYYEYGNGDIHLGEVAESWLPEWAKCLTS